MNYIKCPKCGREEPAFDYAHVCGPVKVRSKINERIKLLKHQASLWCDENIPEQFSEETNGYGSAWEDKFAELIVRECCSVADDWYQNHDSIHWDPAQHIRNHFSIEDPPTNDVDRILRTVRTRG